MGNSTIALQEIVDGVSTIGDLNPVLVSTGGFAAEPALTIANDVRLEMLSERFPWKWNRFKLSPITLISRQQDYASISEYRIGWLENAFRIQVNSTQVPPPVWPVTVVRDLAVSRVGAGWPTRACWFPNDQLEQFPWPGPGVNYTDPVGQPNTPANKQTNINDANGNILVLTTFGTTGNTAPVIPPWPGPLPKPDNWPAGITVTDGTCVWTGADPKAQGIRVFPPPTDVSADTWLIRIFAQEKAKLFKKLTEKLDPIPDDQTKWFRDGFIAYAHRYSATPSVKARYQLMKQEWLAAMESETKQANREDESKGFYPAQGLLSPEYYTDPGPGNPYWRQWGGQ